MSRNQRLSGRSGFSLLEVVFAIFILTVGALIFTVALASANRMNTLGREQSVANNAIRAYLERIKNTYPAQGSTDLTSFQGLIVSGSGRGSASPLYDLDLYYATNGAMLDKGALKNSTGRVSLCTGETSAAAWGPVFSSDTTVAAVSSTMSTLDRTACGLPRDLDGDGAATTVQCAQNKILEIPIKVELFWISGADQINANTKYQSMTVYAIISAQH